MYFVTRVPTYFCQKFVEHDLTYRKYNDETIQEMIKNEVAIEPLFNLAKLINTSSKGIKNELMEIIHMQELFRTDNP